MAFKGTLSESDLTDESKFRLKVTNWDKYQGDDTHLFVKLIPAGIADSIRHESLSVRGLFFDILRHAGSSRKVGWIVEGDNQPITLVILADILHLNASDSSELQLQIQRLMVTNRITLYVSVAESDAETLPSSAGLPDLAKPSKTLPEVGIKNRVEESRVEKRREEKRREEEPASPKPDKRGTPDLSSISPEIRELTKKLYLSVKLNMGNNYYAIQKPRLKKWIHDSADSIDKMIRLDSVDSQTVREVIEFLRIHEGNNGFKWGKQVLSGRSLRKSWQKGTLMAAFQSGQQPPDSQQFNSRDSRELPELEIDENGMPVWNCRGGG